MPKQAYQHDAAFDLYSAEEVMLKPLDRKAIKTGLVFELPENCHAEVRPRSGLALKHGITVLNSPGTIDAGYRGELLVLLTNLSREDFLVSKGERIAQILFSKVNTVSFEEVDEVTKTHRGERGIGSSGR